MIKHKNAVVLGGGIAGILSALILRQRYESVFLIDAEQTIGGLLRSYVDHDGRAFDHGTHLLMETGTSGIDELLFDVIFDNEEDWVRLPYVRAGNFCNGIHNDKSGCIDLRSFDQDTYHKILIEILHAQPHKATNEGERIAAEYGPTLKKALFDPVIRSHLGAELDDLAIDSSWLLIPPYMIALNENMSEQIKQSEYFNKIFAFHSYKARVAKTHSFYPKPGKGGMGFWVSQITRKLQRSGVQILTGQTVRNIESKQGRVTALETNNGRIDDIDLLVWSAPTFHYLRACGQEFNALRPRLRKMLLCHLTYRGALQTDVYYSTNFDVSKVPFRVTFYTNLAPRHNDERFHLTVEVFVDDEFDEASVLRRVDKDLRDMQIISNDCVLESHVNQFLPAGFPIPAIAFKKGQEEQLALAKSLNSNVLFAGRANGGFFLQSQLQETYKLLNV